MAGLIGVFGGTFDPPHVGHLVLADEGKAACGLSRVLFVVTGQPPHKPNEPVSPIDVRVAMVEAAIRSNPAFALSRADIDRPGPHYAVDTLRWLAERDPHASFVYLMGADSLRDLPTWHTPAEFVAACTLMAVMRRPDVNLDMPALESQLPGVTVKTRLFDAPLMDIAAHDIRSRVREGRPYRYLVSQGVADIIERQGLYR